MAMPQSEADAPIPQPYPPRDATCFDESSITDLGLHVPGQARWMTIEQDGRLRELRLEPIDLLDEEVVWAVNEVVLASGSETELGTVRCYRGSSEGDLVFVALMENESPAQNCVLGSIFPSMEVVATWAEADGLTIPDPVTPAQTEVPTFRTIDIALDADTEFHSFFGLNNLARTRLRMLLSLATLDFIFQREVGGRYRLTYINCWTQEPDPYFSLNTRDLVEGMRAYWNLNRGWVPRDTAHLLSGKRMDKFGATPQVGGTCYAAH